MGFFDKIKQGLKKTSDAVNHSLDSVFAAFVKVDDDLLEELEEALILSDVGASTAAKIVAEVEKRAKLRKTTTADELRDLLARGADRQYARQPAAEYGRQAGGHSGNRRQRCRQDDLDRQAGGPLCQ